MKQDNSETENSENKMFVYNSPSRYFIMTPIRSALKSSNNNPHIFLDKIKQIDSFKKKIEKLHLERNQNQKENYKSDI